MQQEEEISPKGPSYVRGVDESFRSTANCPSREHPRVGHSRRVGSHKITFGCQLQKSNDCSPVLCNLWKKPKKGEKESPELVDCRVRARMVSCRGDGRTASMEGAQRN